MKRYAMLANPGHNRIYFDNALKIALVELEALSEGFGMEIDEIGEIDIGLPAAIGFVSAKELEKKDLRVLGYSSLYFALFEIVGEGLLKPISVPDFHTFPESMVKILKYSGKTNEQFTRLMVNLALSACGTSSERMVLIDPMCGKGTTLYEGLIRGFDVNGVEINKKWVQETMTYSVRFMKEGKYKHKAQKMKISDTEGRKSADGFSIIAAAEKNDYKSGNTQKFQLFNADTRKTDILYKKKSCDILVCDLPYGVQHGSKSDRSQGMSRKPLELLKEALPAWKRTIKNNGSLVLSFNEFTMKYGDLSEILGANGFEVLNSPPYVGYLHRVDQSINRNLIVAVKNR